MSDEASRIGPLAAAVAGGAALPALLRRLGTLLPVSIWVIAVDVLALAGAVYVGGLALARHLDADLLDRHGDAVHGALAGGALVLAGGLFGLRLVLAAGPPMAAAAGLALVHGAYGVCAYALARYYQA